MRRRGPSYLTRSQEMRVRRLLAAGATHAEAAAAVGVTYRRLKTRLDDQLADVRVGRGRGGGGGKFVDLEVDEIYARAAALRETWTPDRTREAWNPNWTPPPDFAGGDD